MKRYVLWLDYGGYEGWRPTQFDTLEEVYTEIKNGGTYGQPFEIMQTTPFAPVQIPDNHQETQESAQGGQK